MRKLEEKYADKVVLLRVDADEVSELTDLYNLDKMPAFVFLKNGQVAHQYVGKDEAKLDKTIAELTS